MASPATARGAPAPGAVKSRFHARVPPYLLDRKLELAEKAAAVAAAAAPRECPEGTHVLDEEERVQARMRPAEPPPTAPHARDRPLSSSRQHLFSPHI
jgi:predicted nucleotidyltransferase